MALHTEGEARARFATAISAEHFAAVAQARLRGEAASADGSAADGELHTYDERGQPATQHAAPTGVEPSPGHQRTTSTGGRAVPPFIPPGHSTWPLASFQRTTVLPA